MKQVVFDKNGNIMLESLPIPDADDNMALVRNCFSVISSGTEKSMVSLMKKPLWKMAIERKDLAKQVIRFAKDSGIKKTMQLISSRIDVWHQLGYSCCGYVAKAGKNIKNIGKGDLVACCGSGFANHAEYVAVPRNMLVKVPSGVKEEEAAFAGIGAIAMQSVRQLKPELGETIAVFGLGLLGQIVAQILKANGCKVIGIDIDKKKLKKSYIDCAATPAEALHQSLKFSSGTGVDGVIIAAATKANIIDSAFEICRKKARVVLLGVCGLKIDRSKMYEKELEFKISTAFGPGYYDPEYESSRIDYPLAYVRWTMNRNMQAFLELIKDRKVDVLALVDKTISISEAKQAYREIISSRGSSTVLFSYSKEKEKEPSEKDYVVNVTTIAKKKGTVNIGLIGAGNFVKAFLLPAIKRIKGLRAYAVATRSGPNATKLAREIKASYATTDYKAILKDKNIDMVIIGTRHNTHAKIALDAIRHKKHIFVEKPAALSFEELTELKKALKGYDKLYTVGFNRRYSDVIVRLKEMLSKDKPIMANYVFNNSFLPEDHWVNTEEGGGRVIGEACHIFDLFNFLTGSRPVRLFAEKLSSTSGKSNDDNNIIATAKYANGSVCSLVYSCIGNSSAERETMTVFQDSSVFKMEGFKSLEKNGKKIIKGPADEGHFNEMLAISRFMQGKQDGLLPLSKEEALLATEASLKAIEAIKGQKQ